MVARTTVVIGYSEPMTPTVLVIPRVRASAKRALAAASSRPMMTAGRRSAER
jgi:hypothetical protein